MNFFFYLLFSVTKEGVNFKLHFKITIWPFMVNLIIIKTIFCHHWETIMNFTINKPNSVNSFKTIKELFNFRMEVLTIDLLTNFVGNNFMDIKKVLFLKYWY